MSEEEQQLMSALELDDLVDRLVDDPRLLKALTDRLVRRKAWRDEVQDAARRSRGTQVDVAGDEAPAEVEAQASAEDAPPGFARAEPPAPDAEKPTVEPPCSTPQEILDRSVISTALADWLARNRSPGGYTSEEPFAVIIDLNLSHAGVVQDTNEALTRLIRERLPDARVNAAKAKLMPQYVFVKLTQPQLMELIRLDLAQVPPSSDGVLDAQAQRLIKRIWPDFQLRAKLHRTGATIKAEAARVAFAAGGQDIVWAVMDSGIDGAHPHFARHKNLEVAPLAHLSLLDDDDPQAQNPLIDEFGHGTHVAGVIAGEWTPEQPTPPPPNLPQQLPFVARIAYRDGEDVEYRELKLERLSGIAPRTKLVSYKVLDREGEGEVSTLMAAIADVQQRNGYGKELKIHGVNISIGYPFDPEWFPCGQSPVCVEVDRLVRSGVVVVVAAGNSGYGTIASKLLGPVSSGLVMTINDPGNAELAITVGSAHRESPHAYGVSYFSSKGPTGDGRLKPDLVAPGERILSCAAGKKRADMQAKNLDADYVEDSGTSMATPHVSGAAAVFLSVQREYIGRPDAVKRILKDTATDLGRHRDFQGAGMVDVMRAIQSV